MIHQTGFARAGFADKKKLTRREKFLARMEEVIPRARLPTVIEPHYPKCQSARPPANRRAGPPIGLERMPRVCFLQQWHGPADEALEDALYDSQALQHFARMDLAADGVPDAATLLKFRRLLETRDLCKGLFTAINADLAARSLIQAPAEGAEKETCQAVEKAKASVRAFVEHPFHIVKNLFRHRKARCRGLAKNGRQLYTLFGLANAVIGARRACPPVDRLAAA